MTGRLAQAVVVLFALAALLAAANLFWTSHEVERSQHQWCAVLTTLDNADQKALQATPSQRPHGAYSFALINDFHNLRQRYGCG